MTNVAIVGARKWDTEASTQAAMDFVRGYLEGLPKYTTVVAGGHEAGVDRWVQQYFDLVKERKSMHLVTYSPQHMQGGKYSDLNYAERAKQIVEHASKMVVILPDEYQGGTTSEVVAVARVSHLPHQVVRISPEGTLASVLEIKAKDTFINVPEGGVPVGIPGGSSVSTSVHGGPKPKRKRNPRPTATPNRKRPAAAKSRASGTVQAHAPVRRVSNNGQGTRRTNTADPSVKTGSTAGKGRRGSEKPARKTLVLKRGKK